MIKSLFSKGKKKVALLFTAMLAMVMLPMAVGAEPPSQVIDFSDSTGFSFNLMDIINTAWGFIAQFNFFIIFIAAMILFPSLVGIIIWLARKIPKFGGKSA